MPGVCRIGWRTAHATGRNDVVCISGVIRTSVEGCGDGEIIAPWRIALRTEDFPAPVANLWIGKRQKRKAPQR